MKNSVALEKSKLTSARFDEAELVLLECYERLKSSRGADNLKTKIALEGLIKLYKERENKKHQAKGNL